MSKNLPEKDFWVGDRSAVQSHFSMIQAIIMRLATASASCKTWTLALIGAITSLAGAIHQPAVLGYVALVIAIFWYLDVRYLAQEQAYRQLFNRLAAKVRDITVPYDLADAFDLKAPVTFVHIRTAFLSWSTWPMYGVILLCYVIAWQKGWIWLLAKS